MAKCPYCYREEGTHTHDPILLPNGSKYKWSDDTHLIEESDFTKRIYKGTYQVNEDDVIELQDELKILEEDNLPEIDRTIFSPLNTSGKFQITGKHIKEMRDSVEKLLNYFGLTKTNYFNYDEDNNHIIHPLGDKIEWTDPIISATNLQKFQVKYIHIEDLRHFIQSIWLEQFTITPITTYFDVTLSVPPTYSINTSYNFTGDMGAWNIIKFIALSYAGTGNGTIVTSGKSIDDGSGISTKLYMQGDLNVNQSPGNGVSISLQPRAYISISPHIPIKNTSTIQLNASTSLSYAGTGLNLQAYMECLITFSNTNLIMYSYGIHPGTTIIYEINLVKTAFENLNRNIYNDYQSIYGALPSGVSITRIDLKLHSAVAYGGNENITNQISIDNIKLT